MQVKIYIENTQKSPKTRCGTYAYLLECELCGETRTVHGFSQMEASRNKMDLTTCVAALGRMKKPSEIEIIGDLQWIASQSSHLPHWLENGWRTAGGKPVKNMELWQQFYERSKIHKITFTHRKNHAYSEWMRREMKEKYGE